MYHKYQNRKGAKCSQRIIECQLCTRAMGNVKQYIWKYEAQRHYASVHGMRVVRADIGKPDCPIPHEFMITVEEQRYLTKSSTMPELLGF